MSKLELQPNHKVIAFLGVDGVGKSTVAKALADTAHSPLVVGTKYSSWDLSAAQRIRLERLAQRSDIEDPRVGDPDKRRRFFNLSAMTCYRHVRDLTSQQHRVVVDSDPVMKWLMWEQLYGASLSDAFARVRNQLVRTAGGFFPGHIVYVRPMGANIVSELSRRLAERMNNDPYDPKSEAEIDQRVRACEEIACHLRHLYIDGLDIRMHTVITPTLPEAEAQAFARSRAFDILESTL